MQTQFTTPAPVSKCLVPVEPVFLPHILERTAPQSRQRNPYNVYLASLASTGRRSMASRLRSVLQILDYPGAPETFPWHGLRFQHVAAIRSHLVETGKAPNTVNLTLSAIRGVCTAAFNLELLDANDLQRIKAVPCVTGTRLPKGRNISRGELRALFESCRNDQTPAGTRDAALLSILYLGGLRRSEVVGIDVDNVDLDAGSIKVTHGKGDRERLVYMAESGVQALAKWIKIRGAEAGALFVPIRKSGRILSGRITSHALYLILRKRVKEAGVESVTPHDFRRTMVGDLLDAGADLVVIQKLVGHASPLTTSRYDRRPEQAKQRAAGLLTIPV